MLSAVSSFLLFKLRSLDENFITLFVYSLRSPHTHTEGNTKFRHKEKCFESIRVSYNTEMSNNRLTTHTCSRKSALMRFKGAVVICSQSLWVRSLPPMLIDFLTFPSSVLSFAESVGASEIIPTMANPNCFRRCSSYSPL